MDSDQNPNRNPQESVWIPTRNPCGFRPGIRVDSIGIRRNPCGFERNPQESVVWLVVNFDRKNTILLKIRRNPSRRNGGSLAQTPIFIIENQHFLVQMAPQASWPSSMPLGLQNHCLGSRAGVMLPQWKIKILAIVFLIFLDPTFLDIQVPKLWFSRLPQTRIS